MAAILVPSPHHPVVGDRRPDLRLVLGCGPFGPSSAAAHRRRRIVAGLLAVLVLTGVLCGSRPPARPARRTFRGWSVACWLRQRPGRSRWWSSRATPCGPSPVEVGYPSGDIRPLVDQLVAETSL